MTKPFLDSISTDLVDSLLKEELLREGFFTRALKASYEYADNEWEKLSFLKKIFKNKKRFRRLKANEYTHARFGNDQTMIAPPFKEYKKYGY